MNRTVVVKGLLLVVVSIMLGAMAAHYLETKLTFKELNSFQVGVRYQMYGGLILLILGLNKTVSVANKLPVNIFFIGNVLFSFSIYYLSLTTKTGLDKIMGPITPLGGLLMIGGLFLLLYRIVKSK